ncbi:hypothetical protein LUZ61_009093 [Rhynchospora tenuis]|uniref:NB-ARC domain-containing protein n=1 Tax=Rhynchospora tenuis TaxID=198213 RepID=A0AAD6EY96_9POAL|nr:hypothetical protein LUZ61_009093 [Rhynchospora tenuis]
MAGFWNRVLELSAPIIGQPTVDALQKNLDVSRNISRLRATLPRARLLIERSESWAFIYRPIDDLLPLLKEAIDKADHELGEFETQRQRLEGSNWNIQGELVNNFKNWISGFPDNVKSANDMLDHVCNEMENICSMLDIPNSPNQFSEHISWLHAVLPRARLLVERSECWRFRFDPIKELLPQLKEAVYKAEIELDDIESKKRILEGANWRIEDEFLNYLGNWISGSQDKVKSTRVMLDYACNEMEKLCENYKIPENPNEFSNTARPITFSSHPKIYGRDKELDEAINSLGVPRSAGSSGTKRKKIEKLAILPIVGMGGMGKTTLAQMIYRDKCVQSYFDLRIWICVSDKFDIGRLMKEIIECATGKECNITNLNKIEEILEEILKSKRVFLVLDDIWSKDWHRILRPLNEVSEGSVVVLTTRSPEHLQCTENSVTILKSISLEGLEEKIYWDFFRSCAGLVVASENYGELEGIAREICSKLKGIPLAAITLGGLLSKRIDRNHWIKIRDSKMWELKPRGGISHNAGTSFKLSIFTISFEKMFLILLALPQRS